MTDVGTPQQLRVFVRMGIVWAVVAVALQAL